MQIVGGRDFIYDRKLLLLWYLQYGPWGSILTYSKCTLAISCNTNVYTHRSHGDVNSQQIVPFRQTSNSMLYSLTISHS